jgi:ribosomal protein S6--L-glutamate ligase
VAQGGKVKAIKVSEVEEELALRAASAVGAEVAGVDLLPGPDGTLYVIEVNAVPGWRALGLAAGVDVAAELVRYLEKMSHGS